MAGLELAMGTHTSVDAGYRYFNGGRFSSNNYFYAPADGTPGVAATPWRARFSSNEVFVNLNYTFV